PPEFTELAEKWTAGSSRLLITCRDAQVGLAPRGNPAWPFPLGELTLSEGLQLLIGLLENLGIDRAERTRRGWNVKLLKPIVKKTGGHPLALELLAPHIIKLGPQKVAQEVGSLLAKTEQDVMEDRNRSIQASLDFSIKHLSEKSRAALPAISLLAGGCLDITANSVVGLKEDDWAEVKTELERTGLLRSSGNFLQPHPILAEIRALEPKSKLIEHFIHNVAALCNLYRQYIDSDLSKSMMELLENSETVVRRGIYYAIRTENAELSMYVSNTLTDFLNRSGRGGESKLIIQQLKEKIQTLNQETKINSQEPTRLDVKVAFEAASARASEDSKESLKDLQNLLNQLNGIRSWDTKYLRTSILREIGSIYTNYRHEPAKAIEPLREAIMLNEQLEKEGLQNSNKRAATLGSLGAALIDLHRLDEAHIVLQQKLTLNRELDNKQGISSSFHELGIVSMHQGKFKEAERYFREALDFASKAGDKTGMGAIWQKLGAVSDYQRDHNTAFEYFQKAYYAFQKGGEMQGARQALNSLGIVELKRGYNNSAITWFERSLQIAEELDDLSGQAFSLKNIAFVLSQQAEQAKNSATYLTLLEKAISNDKKALAIHEQLGQLKAIADSQNNLAATLLQAGKIDEAEEYAQKSLSFRESINDPNLWQPLSTLEEIAETRGDNTNASQYRRRMEAARKESKQRAGSPALPQQTVLQLLKLSLTARSRGDSMETALASVKAKEGLMEVLEQNYSWLAINLRALASGQNRPIGVEVPPSYQDLLTQVWDSVS
ncbi:MAG: tetratricopeptide repeat protein, partial [Cyanobacteria bacterium P01_F01_bin.143]